MHEKKGNTSCTEHVDCSHCCNNSG